MEAIELSIQEREVKGGRSGNRLRKEGLIPAVVYGFGASNTLAIVPEREFQRQVAGHASSQLFRFKSEVKGLDGRLALVKEVQMDPLKGRPKHVDFFTINENTKIGVDVEIVLTGESPTVKGGDGILNISAHEISIECLPNAIPKNLQVDISGLLLGDSIHAQDVTLPAGIELKSDPELTIVSIVAKREKVEAVVAAPEAAAAAPADAKAADKSSEKGDKK